MKHLFIVNPTAGGKDRTSEVRAKVEEAFSTREGQYEIYVTRAPLDATEKIKAEAGTGEHIRAYACGGDGTFNECISGAVGCENVAVAPFPTGTGNDFCRSMGLPFDPFEALRSILENRRTIFMDVPVLHLGSHSYRFGISAGMGYDAAICQEVLITPGKKFLNRLHMGKLIYLMVALKQFLFLTPSPVTITLDGNKPQTFSRTWFAAVMNQKYEGGGFKFCPNASPEDGLLDVIVIEGISKLKMLFCLPSALWGKHTRIRGVHILQCRNVHITSAHSLPVHKDGESGGIQREFSVTIEKKPLKIIMPVL